MKAKLKGNLKSESIHKHIITHKFKISKELILDMKLCIFTRRNALQFEAGKFYRRNRVGKKEV